MIVAPSSVEMLSCTIIYIYTYRKDLILLIRYPYAHLALHRCIAAQLLDRNAGGDSGSLLQDCGLDVLDSDLCINDAMDVKRDSKLHLFKLAATCCFAEE